ncbi:hypothetical protein KI387_008880 [Taxus chinensis]|uniref:Peroxidase n=1 Tax=Taxus chinensis TaxID=29808 RepID=A0AA38CMN2_TAXCH|nr:hypothetical protein KI387_008880 [Taxus chinensis]
MRINSMQNEISLHVISENIPTNDEFNGIPISPKTNLPDSIMTNSLPLGPQQINGNSSFATNNDLSSTLINSTPVNPQQNVCCHFPSHGEQSNGEKENLVPNLESMLKVREVTSIGQREATLKVDYKGEEFEESEGSDLPDRMEIEEQENALACNASTSAYVQGCDASVLLKSTSTNREEQEAIANKFFRGLDIINEAKAALETSCPRVVSCADILALATRDAVSMLEGSVSWIVRTGRRDGVVSNESEVPANIPSPFDHFSQLTDLFASKGFGVPELVILSGAHTIGKTHCGAFSPRLYNNSGIGDTDPSLDPAYANHLKTICSPSDRTTAVPMDPDTLLIFDDNYYKLLQKNKGLFKLDATLLRGWQARNIINNQIGGDFTVYFSQAMGKLVELEVLTGTDGEIRKLCSSVNSK